MPDIRDLKIHSFSSEDPNFPAKNLIDFSSTTKKWKVGNLKDTVSYVVFQLSEPKNISSVNIGNEGSAFIEVLVADSRNQGSEWRELILATSFMRENDAMNQRNMNQVKCFNSALLVAETMNHEWDLVKIVCKQPFNRNLKYGVAFVTLQSPAPFKPKNESDEEMEKQEVKKKSEEKVKKFGRFTMRMSSSEEEDDTKSSPFSRWKMTKSGESSSSSQIKPSSSMKRTIETKLSEQKKDSSKKLKKSDEKEKPRDRQRFSRLIYESEDDEEDERAEEKIKRDKAASEKSKSSASRHSSSSSSAKKSSPKKHSDTKPDKFSTFLNDDDVDMPAASSSKREKSSSPKKTPKVEIKSKPKKIDYKPFDKLLEGVTFVFSGYVNPERGILRSKALELGAKYQPDWNDKCTHLICAFTNTPKYEQVKLIKGKTIVTAKWIESCYKERKRFPWRRFALDKAQKDESESENEIHETLKKQPVAVDEVMEIEDVENEPANHNEATVPSSQKSFADISTDEDSNMSTSRCENAIFKDKSFFLNSDLSATDKLKLKDQIVFLGGKVSSSSSNVDYVIASSKIHVPSSANSKAEILKGIWISECYELEALIPVTRYKL